MSDPWDKAGHDINRAFDIWIWGMVILILIFLIVLSLAMQ